MLQAVRGDKQMEEIKDRTGRKLSAWGLADTGGSIPNAALRSVYAPRP